MIILKGKIKRNPFKYAYKILIDKALHSFSKSHNKNNVGQIAVFSFDHIGSAIAIDGVYEKESLEITKDFLTEININFRTKVLDIGANIGNHSIFFAQFFEKVYAFEPNPRTYDLLKFNCENSNIETFQYGLSDISAELDFEQDNNNIGNAYITQSMNQEKPLSTKSMRVKVKKLDDEAELDLKNVSLIKIDIEGHELNALKGAEKTIRDNSPVILFEQHPSDFKDGTSDVIEFLKKENYEFFVIENRFRFGKNPLTKIFSLLIRLLFGFQKVVVKSNGNFSKRLYEMIIAVHKDKSPY